MIKSVYTIKIKLPFWIKWLKRFVRLEVKQHKMPTTLRGRKIDIVIIDEMGDYIKPKKR